MQADFAIGMGVPDAGDTSYSKTVRYPNGGKPLVIVYHDGKAAEINQEHHPRNRRGAVFTAILCLCATIRAKFGLPGGIMNTALRPLSTGELLDRTFSLYRSHFGLFVGIFGLPHLVVFAFQCVGVGLQTSGIQLANAFITFVWTIGAALLTVLFRPRRKPRPLSPSLMCTWIGPRA